MRRMICTAILVSAALPGLAQQVSILDLNTTGIAPDGYVYLGPNQPTLDDRLFFRAVSDDGDELFVTDGTAAGTSIEDLSPGIAGSHPSAFTAVGDRIFFEARTLDTGSELWSTQGPHLASMVAELEAGPEGANLRALTAFGDDLFFTALVAGTRGLYVVDSQSLGLTPLAVDVVAADDFTEIVDDDSLVYFKGTALSGGSMEIWGSDGTVAGTEQKTAVACADWGELLGVSTSVFAVCDDGSTTQLLRLDQVPADGVVLVHDFGNHRVEQLTPAGGTLYMVVDDSELWSHDNGTGTITQITSFGQTTQPDNLTRYQGNLLFAADADLGRELYWTDGATVTAIDIRPGAPDSNPSSLRVHDGKVYFTADDGVHGFELWLTDGSPAGTQMVVDLEPGPRSAGIWLGLGPSTPFGLVFSRSLRELWTTDGTPSGTIQIPFPDSFATSPTDLHSDDAGDRVYYVGDLGYDSLGDEVFATDGTVNGTVFLGDVFPGPPGSSARFLATLPNGHTLFTAEGGADNRHLWSTQGNAGDATPTRVIDPDGLSTSLSGTVFDGHFYFCADDNVNGVELWRSDGTSVGTELFFDSHPSDDGSPCSHAIFGDKLYFGAFDGSGPGLWRTDGTAAGTELVARTSSGQSWQPAELTVMGSYLFFIAADDALGKELWRSDGTETGTELVLDINPGSSGSSPWNLLVAGALLYFDADDGATGAELWRTDGTAAGTLQIADLEPDGDSDPRPYAEVNGGLVFRADVGGNRLYFTTGSPGSTTLLLAPEFMSPFEGDRAVLNDHFYFVARTGPAESSELWRTDGTVDGTVDLDLEPGLPGSEPRDLVVEGGRLFFSAYDAATKREIHILEDPLFVEGFESGDLSGWDGSTP